MPTPDKNKAALEGLIAKANAATGGDAATVTDAVDTLIAGFGQGGGENWFDYARSISAAFQAIDFGGGVDFVVEFGSKSESSIHLNALNSSFNYAVGLKSVTLIFEGVAGGMLNVDSTFATSAVDYELQTIDLTHIMNRCLPTGMRNAFSGRGGLKTLIGEIDVTNMNDSSNTGFNGTFKKCYALETVRFKAGTIQHNLSFSDSANLTPETIQNIVDGLADMTGTTARTLTLHADVGAKLTDAQKAAASAKNWTLAY